MRWPKLLLVVSLLASTPAVLGEGGAPDAAQLAVLASQAANASLLWGTYRPNLYFGTRPRLPESLMTGLMWFDASSLEGFRKIRHACEQGDGLTGYGYYKHDGRSFAAQRINDEDSNIVITTEFLKVPGGKHGGEWALRIKGTPYSSQDDSTVSVVFYIGVEGDGGIDLMNKLNEKGLTSPIKFEGDTPDLGDFSIRIVDDPLNHAPEGETLSVDLTRTQFLGIPVSDGDLWRAKDIIAETFVNSAKEKVKQYGEETVVSGVKALFTLSNLVHEEDAANFYAVQKVFQGAFQFDVFFLSDSASTHINGEHLTTNIESSTTAFDARFERVFGLDAKNYDVEHVEFARYLLSNLIGGIGYFHGSSIVDRSFAGEEEDEDEDQPRAPAPQLTPPGTLFTATPSRPFFPRGFYWDEGFHQLLIGQWDNDLSLDIIKHWISLIDEDGWVAREQILGTEARSKVPQEFQIQYPHYANPPTLLMAIRAFIDRLDAPDNHHAHHAGSMGGQSQYAFATSTSFDDPALLPDRHLVNPELATLYLESIYPKLRLNWEWFRRTQKGEVKEWGRKARSKEGYRWRGRTPEHTLTSGLDDYPRANPPNVAELHLDLISWMGFSTRLLKSIAARLGEAYEDDVAEYNKVERNILNNIEDLHWSEADGAYCDVSIDDKDESVHVCHTGYLTLFPFLLGLLPPAHPHLGVLLELVRDEEELWSNFGLRSLSKSDSFYGTGEVYWRGPVWINVNYMALASLYKNYINQPGPYQERAAEIYKELRKNVIDNVFKEYRRTGYVWEQYSPLTGEGQRSHPFTGWTSLVLLIMAEKY